MLALKAAEKAAAKANKSQAAANAELATVQASLDAMPEAGRLQIIGVVGILEWLSEVSAKPHYMCGGTPGKIPLLWDPLGFTSNTDAATLARKRTAELKNGRLAMIGVMSFVSAHYIPDSVPLLKTV